MTKTKRQKQKKIKIELKKKLGSISPVQLQTIKPHIVGLGHKLEPFGLNHTQQFSIRN